MVLTRTFVLIYVDANVFVAAFESDPATAAPARDLFRAAKDQPYELVTSELTIAEVLAPASAPNSLSPREKLEIYRTILLWSNSIRLVPVTRAVLLSSATIRADHRQKLPDAIHVASALQANCRYFCSSDRDSRRLPSPLKAVPPDEAGVSLLIAALRA